MKILLTGAAGQIGWELKKALAGLGEVEAFDRTRLDLSDPDQIRKILRQQQPRLIVNAAAYTQVDRAESEPDAARAVNGVAPGVLAEEAKRLGAAMVHFSTDYVFDGVKESGPYTEEDRCNPLNTYGKTKLEGERAVTAAGIPHLILRTSGVYGMRGENFLRTMQKAAREKKELRVVDDQIGAPTWCRSVADKTREVLNRLLNPNGSGKELFGDGVSGIYHLSCGGQTSWHGFAEAILEWSDLSDCTRLIAVPTAEYPTPAVRPRYCILSNRKIQAATGVCMPHWKDALKECLSGFNS